MRNYDIYDKKKGEQSKAYQCIISEPEELPNDFNDWLDKEVFVETIMYYKKINGKSYGYCSCGAEDIPLEKPRPAKHITCPICGRNVRLRDAKHNWFEERKITCYLQFTSIGWMQRLFICEKYSEYDEKKSPKAFVRYSIEEDQRDSLTYEGFYYAYHPYWNWDFKNSCRCRYRWIEGGGKRHGMNWTGWDCESSDIYTYTKNINMLFKDSEYKYSQLLQVMKMFPVNPFYYLYVYLRHPQIEYLVKLGFGNLTLDFYICCLNGRESSERPINIQGKTAEQICGIKSKIDIDFVAKHNLNSKQVKAYLTVRNWKNKDITAVNFMVKRQYEYDCNIRYEFISDERLYKYWLTLKDSYTIENFLHDYRDYIYAAKFLQMNMNDTKVKTPHDFKYCHDVCLAHQAAMKREIEVKAQGEKAALFVSLMAEYNSIFNYESGNYLVKVPETLEELHLEGEQNHNCVYSYKDSIIGRRSIVVFLRKKSQPEQSFCTVEISPLNYEMVQCRTLHNGAAPEEALEFMKTYVKLIKQKRSKLQSTAISA